MLPRITSALIAKISPLKSETGHQSGQAAFSETTSKHAGGDPSHHKSPEPQEAKILPFPKRDREESESAPPPEPAIKPPAPAGVPAKASVPLGEVFLHLIQWIHQAVRPFSRVAGVEAYFQSLTRNRKGARFKKGTLVDREIE